MNWPYKSRQLLFSGYLMKSVEPVLKATSQLNGSFQNINSAVLQKVHAKREEKCNGRDPLNINTLVYEILEAPPCWKRLFRAVRLGYDVWPRY